ncbi:MAG: AMP-binding protein [Bacteroidales bacterium]|jgi:acyl-CoA ligase (AMP-forming) (exosortase A-associated)
MLTILHQLVKSCESFGNKEAIVTTDKTLTFTNMLNEAISTAEVLSGLGIKKGDRVGICMNKTCDQVTAILGVLFAEAIFVPVLPKLKKSGIEHIVRDCEMSALITDTGRLDEVADFSDQVSIMIGHFDDDRDLAVKTSKYPNLIDLRKFLPHQKPLLSVISADTAAIIYSSGSTGRPKGIVISHRNLFDGALIVSNYLNTLQTDRIAGVLSLNFDYGLNQLWQTILTGATLFLHEMVFPKDLINLITTQKITALPLMPVFISMLFDERFSHHKIEPVQHSLRYICSSGGRVSERMIQQLRNVFPGADIYLMYGLTEAFRSSYLPPDQIDVRPNSIGKSIPDVELFVMDDKYQLCQPGTPGELVHRGGCIAKGYWNDPEKTAERFKQIPQFPGETLVFSGDLVKQDKDGFFYFISRKDSMIKTSGFRVSPTEIEDEANKHEKLTASVAFGIDNQDIGQEIVLVYTTTDGLPVNDKLFLQFLKELLPRYMVPHYLLHFPQFPTTGNQGKIDRVGVVSMAKEKLIANH